jgi:arylsulfatase A-like enzyme
VRGLRDLGMHTATVSSFAERHSAYHFTAGFHEVLNPGKRGLESAHEVAAIARRWLAEHARDDGWFLHVHFWDPHTPYRAPASLGEPFAGAPTPPWLTEEVRARHWDGCGPHSAREVMGYDDRPPPGVPWDYPRQPLAIDSMAEVRRLFDGYDAGVLHADRAIGDLLAFLASAGVLDQTAILVSADHGENLGELNVYGDHQTADQHTTRVPLVLRWPGSSCSAARCRPSGTAGASRRIYALAGTRGATRWCCRRRPGAVSARCGSGTMGPSTCACGRTTTVTAGCRT